MTLYRSGWIRENFVIRILKREVLTFSQRHTIYTIFTWSGSQTVSSMSQSSEVHSWLVRSTWGRRRGHRRACWRSSWWSCSGSACRGSWSWSPRYTQGSGRLLSLTQIWQETRELVNCVDVKMNLTCPGWLGSPLWYCWERCHRSRCQTWRCSQWRKPWWWTWGRHWTQASFCYMDPQWERSWPQWRRETWCRQGTKIVRNPWRIHIKCIIFTTYHNVNEGPVPVRLVPDEHAHAPVPRVVGGHGVLVRRGNKAHELVHQDPDKKLITT